MPNTEPIQTQSPDHLTENQPTENVRRVLGRAALDNIAMSAGHFYGGEPTVVRTPDEYAVIIRAQGDSKGDVRAGSGSDYDSALHATWEGMRSLEKIRTRPIASIEMTHDGAYVDFTKLEHYAPKMAPGTEVYEVPDYLSDALENHIDYGGYTYSRTIEEEGWQDSILALAEEYIQYDPDGKKLVENLGIRSLNHLTPEQAVKFSTAFVQNVSKYENDEKGKPAGERADGMTATELLREGMDRKNDPSWRGNGICRNIACNVKGVFEALKDTQVEMSMLRNTYCVYGGGTDGSGYDDKRSEDDGMTYRTGPSAHQGHAWNRFVTVAENGSATIAITDATWALGKDIDTALEHMDYTQSRATPEIINIFNESEVKSMAFDSLTDYVRGTLRHTTGAGSRLHQSKREQMRGYVVTEYLQAAQSLLETSEGVSDYYSLPPDVVTEVYKLHGKLDRSEIETLFKLDTASSGIEREKIGRIVAEYDKNGNKVLSDRHKAGKLVFSDDDLQNVVYEAIGEARLRQLADVNGRFRARLRGLRPEDLPPFDASARKEDAEELRHFASENNISAWSEPEEVFNDFKSRLRRLAGSESVYEAILAGRTDYDLAKNFSAITTALRNKS